TSASAYPLALPKGFHLVQGKPAPVSNGGLTYEGRPRAGLSGRPRITISVQTTTRPLTGALFGRAGTRRISIQGHPGLVATGLPAPFQSIDWKPTPNALVNVGGWAVSRSLLEKLA